MVEKVTEFGGDFKWSLEEFPSERQNSFKNTFYDETSKAVLDVGLQHLYFQFGSLAVVNNRIEMYFIKTQKCEKCLCSGSVCSLIYLKYDPSLLLLCPYMQALSRSAFFWHPCMPFLSHSFTRLTISCTFYLPLTTR